MVVMNMINFGRYIAKVLHKPFTKDIFRKSHMEVLPSNINDKIISLTKGQDFIKSIELAVECLRNGGVIALPTDTIYGLAGLTQLDNAVDKIYDIKARNYLKPISVSLSEVDEIYKWANVCVSRELLHELLPGPVTVMFERNRALNSKFNPNTNLLGLRVPDDEFIRGVCSRINSPVALTSANISNHESALRIEEFSALWPSIDLIFDSGPITINNSDKSGSTIINLSEEGHYTIVRDGCSLENTVAILKKYELIERL